MITFTDYYNNEVKLSFDDHPFSKNPKHVWVICRSDNRWLLTRHKERGIEFPGGKVEEGETAEEAAVREVHEETGGIVKDLVYVGQYHVAGKGGTIIKNVYFATIEQVIKQTTYYETEGPVWLDEFPKHMKINPDYSFMMKDQVLPLSLKRVYLLAQFH
ncbi:RNA deprotection pyrophosphohydrolase [Sediminibacillus halophilus]|uniref:8-oxo-dGTP diphosphatase n=1 Tax=Sediminibacillus halophilus TaxID=482461 RepID=A0A1G9QNA3_9BACI|nr:nucleoside triphosphatase YtkD [Sediminibacillus halophilus]SDM12478.1 8-oxo-dGTP diphosphatase [Sediminibacillus halophilus]